MIFLFTSEKIITRHICIGYNLNVMRQSACLVFKPIMVDNYTVFFNCTPVGRAGADFNLNLSWLGPDLLVCCLAHRGSTCFSVSYFGAQGSPSSGSFLNLWVLIFFIHHGGFRDLFVCP